MRELLQIMGSTQQFENKATSVTTHVKKLTTENNVFIVAQLLPQVTVTYTACITSMFSVSALLLDDALKPAMPLSSVFSCCFF